MANDQFFTRWTMELSPTMQDLYFRTRQVLITAGYHVVDAEKLAKARVLEQAMKLARAA